MSVQELQIILACSILLSILVTIRGVYFRKKASKSASNLNDVLQALESANQKLLKLEEVEQRFNTFRKDLSSAELTTNMQVSRLKTAQNTEHLKIPERYTFIHPLSEKGVSSQDIASILTISTHEADQLVSLANLAER